MTNVTRIPKKVKEQEKKQLLSLITMDQFLLKKYKDAIAAEINRILMDASCACALFQCPLVNPIAPENMMLRKFY